MNENFSKEAEHAAKKLNNKLYIAIANRMIGETLCFMSEFEQALAHQKVHLSTSQMDFPDLISTRFMILIIFHSRFFKGRK